jgi:hypothetical protein
MFHNWYQSTNIKLLLAQFSIQYSLSYIYLPQYHVMKCPHVYVVSSMWKTMFHTHKEQQVNISSNSRYFILETRNTRRYEFNGSMHPPNVIFCSIYLRM